MCKIISSRLRETTPAGRRKLRREIRAPIFYNFTPSVFLMKHFYRLSITYYPLYYPRSNYIWCVAGCLCRPDGFYLLLLENHP